MGLFIEEIASIYLFPMMKLLLLSFGLGLVNLSESLVPSWKHNTSVIALYYRAVGAAVPTAQRWRRSYASESILLPSAGVVLFFVMD